MIYHVLNGDALVDRFLSARFDGQMVVARECMIEGNVQGDTLEELFHNRAKYLYDAYDEKEEHYFKKVASEFKKLLDAPGDSAFHLWFGYDLFCRANMWFVIWLLQSLPIKKKVFAAHPSYLPAADIWKDFGRATIVDLQSAFQNKIPLTESDLQLGAELWLAFQSSNLSRLKELSKTNSPAFPYLEEVCQAHIERFPVNCEKGRPEKVIDDILNQSPKDFYDVFTEFFAREGVYGFGDAQLKKIYDRVIQNR